MSLLDIESPNTIAKEVCPKCKVGYLINRVSKRDSSFTFLGCSNFPKCKFFYTINNVYGEKAPSHMHPKARKYFNKERL